jgi:hypothetical protein
MKTQKGRVPERADVALARALERAIDDKALLQAAAESLTRRLRADVGGTEVSATLIELVLYELRGRALGER